MTKDSSVRSGEVEWTADDTRHGARLIAKPWGEWTKADSRKASHLLAKAASLRAHMGTGG